MAQAVYAAGNLLAAVAPGFAVLLAARVVTGTVHGVFIGAASAVAASLVPPDHRGRAMSMVFGGIAVNAGIAAGAAAGGWVVATHRVRGTVVVALVCCAAMIPAGAATGRLKISRTAAAQAQAPAGAAAAAKACCRVSGRIQVHLPAHGRHQGAVGQWWWRLSPWPAAETSGPGPRTVS